jgi:DNA-directed RNA polymerase subunit RPC12/RpoP
MEQIKNRIREEWKEKEDEYKCKNCGETWGFCPEDYENEEDYPTICPFCSMPLWQMIRDIYKEEGILEVIKQIKRRYL